MHFLKAQAGVAGRLAQASPTPVLQMRFLQVHSGALPLSAVRSNECDIFVNIGSQKAEGSAAGRSCLPFQFGHTGCVDLTHNRRSIVQSPAVCEQSGEGFLVGDTRQFPQAECEPF